MGLITLLNFDLKLVVFRFTLDLNGFDFGFNGFCCGYYGLDSIQSFFRINRVLYDFELDFNRTL